MLKTRRVGVALCALALVAGSSGCAIMPPTWVFDSSDHPITAPGENLQEIEQQWRWRLMNISEDIAVSKESRCFYQAEQQHARLRTVQNVKPQVICGPYRPLASETTLWDIAPIDYDAAAKRVRVAGQHAFTPGRPLAHTTGVRPDSKIPQFDVVLPEPDSPMAEVGDAIPAPLGSLHGQRSLPDVIRVPGWEFSFAVGHQERFGSISDRRTAPSDKGFLTLVSVPTATGPAPDKEVTLALVVDGKRFPIPKATSPQEVGIALPSTADQIQIAVIFDGLEQTIDTRSGKRTSSAAAALYRPVTAALSDAPRYETGSPTVLGPHIIAGLAPTSAVTSAWDPELGWAPEGHVWVSLDGVVAVTTFHFTGNYDDDRYAVTSATPGLTTLGSLPARAQSVSLDEHGISYHYVVQAPLGSDAPLPLSLAVKASGPKAGSYPTPNPATLTHEIEFHSVLTVH